MVEAKKYSEGMDRGYLAYLLEKEGYKSKQKKSGKWLQTSLDMLMLKE